MIALLPFAVTVGYDLPRPLQQGSAPQIGTDAGEVIPAGNQQQQPLQSVHDATCVSGMHTALHDEESPGFDFAASIVPVDPLEPDPLSSFEAPPVPLVLLLQAASPTVDDAPMATMTWKSLSIFMKQPYPQMGELGTLVVRDVLPAADERQHGDAHGKRTRHGSPR